jgi:hypothetical protein
MIDYQTHLSPPPPPSSQYAWHWYMIDDVAFGTAVGCHSEIMIKDHNWNILTSGLSLYFNVMKMLTQQILFIIIDKGALHL